MFFGRKKFFSNNGEFVFLKKGSKYDVILDNEEHLLSVTLVRNLDKFLLFRKMDSSFVYICKIYIESIREKKREKKEIVHFSFLNFGFSCFLVTVEKK